MATMKLRSRGMTRIRMPAMSAMRGESSSMAILLVVGALKIGPRPRSSAGKPPFQQVGDLGGLLERCHVPRILDDLEARAGDSLRKLPQDLHGHQLVVPRGHDQCGATYVLEVRPAVD